MSLSLKRFLVAALGLLGAVMSWPPLLLIQSAQASFPGYLSFSIAQGLVLGCVFGAIFGSIEGIVVSSRSKAAKGLLFGAIAGLASGTCGVIAGQSFVFSAGQGLSESTDALSKVALYAINGAGWTIIAVFVAAIEGFRARSPRKIAVGLLGGAIGGVIGGTTLQFFLSSQPGNQYALLAGLCLFGLSLSICYALFEKGFSFGSIKLLNGPLRGKEYLITKSRMTVGKSHSCDIVLDGYREVADSHARITVKKGRIILSPTSKAAAVRVNDERTEESALRREDVFSIGSAKFMYGFFS
jgi:MFS family permease